VLDQATVAVTIALECRQGGSVIVTRIPVIVATWWSCNRM
jgi:hypothetical protein